MASLYCILARAADRAVIFRRGPSKLIRLISWNLADNTFEPGQWFAGQIYVRKCDLSPDGRKLVYFAAKHRGPLPTWIAVSTPPYLTAHVLWRGLGTWNDISLLKRALSWPWLHIGQTAALNRNPDSPCHLSCVSSTSLGRAISISSPIMTDWSAMAGA